MALTLSALSVLSYAQIPDYVPTDGLVAWYPFSGNGDDSSPFQNHAENFGATSAIDRHGIDGDAMYFNSSSYMRVANSSSINIPTGNDLTWTIWLQPETDDEGGSAFEKWNGNNNQNRSQLILRVNADADAFNCIAWCDNNSVAPVSGSLSTNDWQHVALRTKDMVTELFVNGTLIDSNVVENSGCTNAYDLFIGTRNLISANTRAFKGRLDDFGIWDRALTDSELQAVFNPSPGCTNPAACNYDISANVENGTCDLYSCRCLSGTVWDSELGGCVSSNTADINNDGCVQLNDLLDLLSAYGDCGVEEAPWACGDPLSYQGYDYATVLIGDQCWFAENLLTQSYRNGAPIASSLNNTMWAENNDGATCVYGEGETTCTSYSSNFDSCDPELSLSQYGRLYNGYAIQNASELCPESWHVPSDGEWSILIDFLGEMSSIGSMMKSEIGWTNGGNGNNLSGFNGKPGGTRYSTGEEFQWGGFNGVWWSSSTSNASFGWVYSLQSESSALFRLDRTLHAGYSIRCIKDTE